MLLTSAQQARGQAATTASRPAGYTAWFEVHNNALLLRTGTQSKPLNKDITLLNGTHLSYKTCTAALANGKKVALQEGDLVDLDGNVVFAQSSLPPPPPAPATPPPAPVAVPALKPAPVAFTYLPKEPVNGKLKGVVELGASGFNSFIVRIDQQKNWKLEKSELGNSLVLERMATEEDVRKGLKSYIGQMLDYGVDGRDIHFVVSAGALTAKETTRIVKSLAALNYVVNTVTPEREGALALQAALPADYANKAFVVDIGSANTKLSWLENGTVQTRDSYGSKYFQANTEDATVTADVRAKAEQIPATLRSTCFIIGGVPYEMAKAKAVRQGKERFTVLDQPSEYLEMSGAKSKSGLTIYQAITTATSCPQFVFDWDANFTIGYLLTLPK
ncbi:MAG TPA: DUF6799 domain-containing protein [Hymenobacter sp.]|nr:DUF6799 domain-containing protein [Hymenobacter sp.]